MSFGAEPLLPDHSTVTLNLDPLLLSYSFVTYSPEPLVKRVIYMAVCPIICITNVINYNMFTINNSPSGDNVLHTKINFAFKKTQETKLALKYLKMIQRKNATNKN